MKLFCMMALMAVVPVAFADIYNCKHNLPKALGGSECEVNILVNGALTIVGGTWKCTASVVSSDRKSDRAHFEDYVQSQLDSGKLNQATAREKLAQFEIFVEDTSGGIGIACSNGVDQSVAYFIGKAPEKSYMLMPSYDFERMECTPLMSSKL